MDCVIAEESMVVLWLLVLVVLGGLLHEIRGFIGIHLKHQVGVLSALASKGTITPLAMPAYAYIYLEGSFM